jgi:hypothetical protein
LSENHIKQFRSIIAKNIANESSIMPSVEDVAHDVNNGKAFNKGPLSVLFGLLRGRPCYSAETKQNFYEENEKQRKNEMDVQKAEKERHLLEKFEKWRSSVSPKEVYSALVKYKSETRTPAIQEIVLKQYFEREKLNQSN